VAVGEGVGVAVAIGVVVDVGVGLDVGVGVPVGVGVGPEEVYSSALAKALILISTPPAASTMPFGSNVAVNKWRAVLRLPVEAQLPLAGSYSSALAVVPFKSSPPARSTMPSGSKVAVCA
jgi:hypothetical protein